MLLGGFMGMRIRIRTGGVAEGRVFRMECEVCFFLSKKLFVKQKWVEREEKIGFD